VLWFRCVTASLARVVTLPTNVRRGHFAADARPQSVQQLPSPSVSPAYTNKRKICSPFVLSHQQHNTSRQAEYCSVEFSLGSDARSSPLVVGTGQNSPAVCIFFILEPIRLFFNVFCSLQLALYVPLPVCFPQDLHLPLAHSDRESLVSARRSQTYTLPRLSSAPIPASSLRLIPLTKSFMTCGLLNHEMFAVFPIIV